jgi:hypothetical protein
MEPLGKHITAETISMREWTMLFARAVPGIYKEDNWGNKVSSAGESVRKWIS